MPLDIPCRYTEYRKHVNVALENYFAYSSITLQNPNMLIL